MKTTLFAVAVLLWSSVASAQTVSFDCSYGEYTNVNRFTASVSVDVNQVMNGSIMYKFEGLNLVVNTTDRGNDKQSVERRADNLKGVAYYVPAGLTKQPYWFLRVIDVPRDVKFWFAVDHPRKLNSTIKIDGQYYHSACRSR